MPLQSDFHNSNAREKLIRGSNRSGKTTAAAVEFARAVTGQDNRYPKENGIAYLVGKDGKEVANVMYKLAFRAGAFKIIRDETTGEWRAFNPSSPLDAGKSKQARPAPPLIPPRMIKYIAWENKKANLPSLISLHNGWEIHFFSSNAKPPHGSQIDLAWFDEEIVDPDWYPETSARLVDRDGRFLWSATPQAGTVQLYELHERAEREAATLPKDKRRIEEFVALLHDNQHLTAQQKADFESKLSPDEVMVRIHGEFASHGLRVFPEFHERTHVCPYFDIPLDWTRYVAIDPGRQICGALFLAMPPPDSGDYAYLYDELYLAQCSAALFGQKMRDKTAGQNIQAFIIDHQEGRKTETGSGRSVEDQYSEELEKNRVTCVRTGSNFTWGVADPEGGVEAVRAWLRPRGQLSPRLRVLDGRCNSFIWEIKRYWYEQKCGVVTDKPRSRGPVHLCACMRYLVQDSPVYVPHVDKKPRPGTIWLEAQKLMKPKGKGSNVLNFGPGAITFTLGA